MHVCEYLVILLVIRRLLAAEHIGMVPCLYTQCHDSKQVMSGVAKEESLCSVLFVLDISKKLVSCLIRRTSAISRFRVSGFTSGHRLQISHNNIVFGIHANSSTKEWL